MLFLKHIWFWFVIMLFLMLTMPIVPASEWFSAQAEVRANSAFYGPEANSRFIARAQQRFAWLFVDTGIYDASLKLTQPAPAKPRRTGELQEVDVWAFGTYVRQAWDGVLRALSGDGSSEVLSIAYPGANRDEGLAAADIDNDGFVEILVSNLSNQILAYEHDGTPKWSGIQLPGFNSNGGSVALGDVDNNGDVEIAYDRTLADHNGLGIFTVQPFNIVCSATALADLVSELEGAAGSVIGLRGASEPEDPWVTRPGNVLVRAGEAPDHVPDHLLLADVRHKTGLVQGN